ncbi:hypothetical protein ACSBPU_06285 [Parapusillimonas sp. JC17]|uniref:hypothetical protein n=1 Tax=Parapusillimonas sp. JC17 TaxID=3445768 RepID=UPI000408FCD5
MTGGNLRAAPQASANGTSDVWAHRWFGVYDVILYRPPTGWTVEDEWADLHPHTGKRLRKSQWWLLATRS